MNDSNEAPAPPGVPAPPGPAGPRDDADKPDKRLLALSLAVLGVVYGDIGTSPLYAFRQAFVDLSPTPGNVLGILSLIFWSLMIVVSVKYLSLVMRADNRGEGGILALLALLNPWHRKDGAERKVLIALGLFGAALLYGDGMITPAISVLSAVEGLKTAARGIDQFVLPITVVILFLLFLFQKRGTAGVGAVFGPVMLLWFGVLGALGLIQIWRLPGVLLALDPRHAVRFMVDGGAVAYVVLGAVFLVVTGCEALYADMGHFGRRPIRVVWFVFVLPCLVLNYFGQGALVLADPTRVTHPFYGLAPGWALYPLIGLATAATVIASQAVISGSFSLTRQAIQLGQSPRLTVVQTSSEEAGQIYVPAINWALAIGTIALVLGFKSSDELAGAYGVAVSTTMVITTVLAFAVMRERWHWRRLAALATAGALILVDLAFLGANSVKVLAGGWVPLVVGALVYLVMSTWHRGRELLFARLSTDTETLASFVARLGTEPPIRVPGTAVFLIAPFKGAPPMLRHHLQHNQALHERVALLSVLTEDVPRVGAAERLTTHEIGHGVCQVYVRYGFMQIPNVPVALRLAAESGFDLDLERVTYYVGRESLIPSDRIPGMALWRERLFAFLSRNAVTATAFYRLPPERVVELGIQVEM